MLFYSNIHQSTMLADVYHVIKLGEQPVREHAETGKTPRSSGDGPM